jgi:hypothetical protein
MWSFSLYPTPGPSRVLGGGGEEGERDRKFYDIVCRKCSLSEEKFRNLCAIVRLMSVSKYPPLSRLTAERVSKHE